MRIQCPRCDETVEVERFTTATAPPRLTFHCTACDESVTLTSASPREEPGRPALEDGSEDAALAERTGDDVLWRSWDAVAESFATEGRHDAFLAACEAARDLPFAAARYREWAESHPEDEIAAKRLQQIMALAQVKAFLVAAKDRREEDPVRKAVVLGLMLLAFVIIAALTAPLFFRGASSDSSPGPGVMDPGVAMPPALQNLRPAVMRRRASPRRVLPPAVMRPVAPPPAVMRPVVPPPRR